jgi:hypothetical protein
VTVRQTPIGWCYQVIRDIKGRHYFLVISIMQFNFSRLDFKEFRPGFAHVSQFSFATDG